MERDILDEVQRLRAERRPFALATVVAAKQPASGTPGARAIVLADGKLEGWIGGSCARPTVVRQGLEAIADGASRLVVLRPDAQSEEAAMSGATMGVVNVPMLCASQGELQIFVEPFLPRIELAIIGASPAARALAHLGTLLEFDVCACDPDAIPPSLESKLRSGGTLMETFPEASRLVPSLDALTPQLGAHCYVVVATMNAY
ncbi:MAG TPA: XdhC family protein, partial [Ktedonobacterales bacterium]|nr:XdhC family protein [Ktedonobacterales bacterium]